MKLIDIYEILNTISPFDLQEKWDNSGINIGDKDTEITKIYLSLDIDSEYLENVENGSLIITHHPLLISPIKSFNFVDRTSKLLKTMIKKDISLISLHTNFDKTHLNHYFVSKVLGFNILTTNDFVAYVEYNSTYDSLIQLLKDKLSVDILKTVKTRDDIEKIAITTGSGMSLLSEIDADCFLTGDIKYHDALEAKERNINLIDIGHFESERYFCEIIEDVLKNNLKINEIVGIISNKDFKNPFNYN
ncbi:MAG: Nif3-like dinuclear metal center hexameric protein [Arcobacteraceae bacterium]|nr:Nif3-like dinuclear metal center hexameric protein [Arcobacteraceae bacterium]